MQMPIEIFYDGLDEKIYANQNIKGFTTNCTLFSRSQYSYKEFYNKISVVLNGRPISFQIWKDDLLDAIEQVNDIHSISPTIFVKIPIVNSHNQINLDVLKYSIDNNIPVNATCIYTTAHLDALYDIVRNTSSPLIVSIFAGPISDTGVDPTDTVLHANRLFKARSNTRILWAGCREVYTITRAEEVGCHIITVPDAVISKLNGRSNLDELTILRVNQFQLDAKNIVIC